MMVVELATLGAIAGVGFAFFWRRLEQLSLLVG